MNLQFIDEYRRLAETEIVRLRDVARNTATLHEHLLAKRDDSHDKSLRKAKSDHAKLFHELLGVVKDSKEEVKIARGVAKDLLVAAEVTDVVRAEMWVEYPWLEVEPVKEKSDGDSD